MRMPLIFFAVGATLALGAPTAEAGDVAAGEARYNVNCVNCHGRTGKGMASFPPIRGRDAAYINDRLSKYRAREKIGPNSAIMMDLTKDLSDADIANLAAYVAETFQ
ncbi:MAG: c-type cytochrome [Paracoccaceae bacterium]